MNLKAEKLEVIGLILNTNDKVVSKAKALLKRDKALKKDSRLAEFYDRFRSGIHEIKSSLEGKTELKDAQTWLAEGL